ncbi:aryl-sulfate sulfotransferase [Pseudoflavonifractor phocaeensis]|uniref:aryl-sulfate sulfotransferase n=1 Tax=Pseudoflavonifractor phocaeensis TaxID=1870988 RepID=UPI001956BD28|nr:aryl-sulfate sulfotransferase [Pseudoflavonifractor phocaeensis]MBM6886581.1 aryl-sulfate sulfotransferase [Pseudoflavonifractor phocaeensis]
MTKKRNWKRLAVILVVAAVALAVIIPVAVLAVSKLFTAQEHAVRTDWSFETGDVIAELEEWQVDFAEAELGEGLRAIQLVPQDIGEEGFTFYDLEVQQRLDGALQDIKTTQGMSWTATTPLAVLNPFGTGSNGLYLYFETEQDTKVIYTIHVEADGISDFTAEAADASGQEYTRNHEFQLIGLVPGERNEVTLTMTGTWGNTRQVVRFSVDMPETSSGYSTRLEVTEGSSDQPQAEGLFAMMRVNGYLGYGFFFDDDGVMRYEMVLEGYGFDRLLFDGDEILTCVSSSKLARIDGLGRVTRIYTLDGYDLHHDIGYGAEGELLALAEEVGGETVEDRLLSIDLETGEVTQLLDFSQLMEPYFEMTRKVGPTDDFFWQAGEWDWLHLNSLQYMPEDDSLIVSSRETSAIIKVKGLHSQPELDWLAGDERFWQDTPYAGLCLTQEGDFVPQYGQHCVEYLADGEEDGVYYLAVYNNNYWSLNSRDFTLEVADSVGTGLYLTDDETSQVYVYRIDENNRTFALEDSFDVPYSSIVSNGSQCGDQGNWVVNSGVAMVFGEYDADGELIREYAYKCTMQNYRTFKYEMNIWFR